MKKKITPSNILYFIEGNLKKIGDTLGVLPLHEQEQVLWRSQICANDCVKYGYCIYCGCNLPGKFYVNKSCNNGERFPDLMTREKWEKYKLDNSIEIIK